MMRARIHRMLNHRDDRHLDIGQSVLDSSFRDLHLDCKIFGLHPREELLQGIHAPHRVRRRARGAFELVADDASASEKIESFLRREFRKKSRVYPSDLAFKLEMDYETVREIISKMIEEGKLEVAT